MARSQWENLSASYKARLERNGITRSRYENGESLSAARGHSKTPERPARAESSPERFRDYLNKRITLENKIISFKAQLFGGTRKFNYERSKKNVQTNSQGKLRSNADLQQALLSLQNYDDSEEWWESLDEETYSIMGYH